MMSEPNTATHSVPTESADRVSEERAVLATLPPLAVGVATILVVFLAVLILGGSAAGGAVVITAYATLLVLFLILIIGLHENRVPPHAAQYIATAAAILTLGTVLISLRSGEDATYTYLVVVVMIGFGYIVLSRQALLFILVLAYTAWAVAAMPIISSLDFDRLTFSLAVGAILAVAIHAGRMNQFRHHEHVLLLEHRQQEALRVELVERQRAELRVRHQLDMEQLLSSVATDLAERPASETDPGVHEGLERIGRFAGVDRSFLILLSEDRKTFDRIYDWRVEGLDTPTLELKGKPVESLPWTVDEISRNRLLNVDSIANLPDAAEPLRKLLESSGVQSVLAVPVAYGSIFSGLFGFDMETTRRHWEEEEINLLQLAGDIVVRALERKRYESMLERMASYDALTDLPNRALFNDRMSQAIAQSTRSGEMFSLLMFDIDDYKLVNDSYGHLAGDQVLCQIAERLSGFIRRSDTLARLGGDEFAIIQRNAHNEEGLSILIEKVLHAFEEPFKTGLDEMRITVSMGATLFAGDREGNDLVHRADVALYEIKFAGGAAARINLRSTDGQAEA